MIDKEEPAMGSDPGNVLAGSGGGGGNNGGRGGRGWEGAPLG